MLRNETSTAHIWPVGEVGRRGMGGVLLASQILKTILMWISLPYLWPDQKFDSLSETWPFQAFPKTARNWNEREWNCERVPKIRGGGGETSEGHPNLFLLNILLTPGCYAGYPFSTLPYNEKVACSKKYTQFKTRVQKPNPIWDRNGQNPYPIYNQKG